MPNNDLNQDQGSAVQIGETIQHAMVGVMDGSSTIFRSMIGTIKDSSIFAIRSGKEVTHEAADAIFSTLKKGIEETRNVSIESTKVAFAFANELGRNLKSSIIGTVEGSHEVCVKTADTAGKTVVDLTQNAYNVGEKVGTIAKSASINTIHGTAEVSNELFGKIKSGVNGVINIENIKFGRKKVEEMPRRGVFTPPDVIENN